LEVALGKDFPLMRRNRKGMTGHSWMKLLEKMRKEGMKTLEVEVENKVCSKETSVA
jgi:hypothetical protein